MKTHPSPESAPSQSRRGARTRRRSGRVSVKSDPVLGTFLVKE
jgi:hypothetical protein